MIFSSLYEDFFKKVYNLDLTPTQLTKSIEKEIPPVCEEMKIGKILISVNLPASFCEKGLRITNYSLFEKKVNAKEEPVVTEFTTFSGGKVIITSYPSSGNQFADENEKDVQFLHQQLYLLFSRSNMNKLIHKATETDSLTGLLNTTGIIKLGESICERKLISKFSVIFMNIKSFKKINDTVNANNGDKILQQYGIIISNFLAKDGAIGRLGGDNFAVIIKNSRLGEFLKFLENIKITVDVEGNKKTAIINVRSGICQGNPMIPNFEAHIGCASTALKVVRTKPNVEYLVYTPEMGQPKPKKLNYM